MKVFYYLTKAALLIAAVLIAKTASAQNVGINSSGSAPAASAGLDVSFTDKGLLIPRVALTATNSASPVTSPATSLLVYNTATAGTSPNNVTPGYYYYNGSTWVPLNTQWSTSGSNIYYNTGNVGIGTSTFNATSPEKFLVDAGTSSSYLTAIGAKGTSATYVQFNVQNLSSGVNASTDIVATNNTGSETGNFIDMGINSSTNTSTGTLGGANTAYLYSTGTAADFVIGNLTPSKNMTFFSADGTGTIVEKMRLNTTGVTMAQAIKTVTADYTLTIDDYSVLVNNPSGNVTITLPAAASFAGRCFSIKKLSAGGGSRNVVVNPNGAELIDNGSTISITTQYTGYIVQSDGTSWWIINR